MRTIYLCALASLVSYCAHKPADPWAGKLYVGDPARQAVVRAQEAEAIVCSAPTFGDMICMRSADFESFAVRFHEAAGKCPEVKAESEAPEK